MRPLNRPMFRYGGPIKEGIMSGIKEPRQNYNRAGKVLKYIPGGQNLVNKISTGTKDIIPRTIQKIKNFYSGDPSRYGVPAAEGIKQKTIKFLKPDKNAGVLTNKYLFDRTLVPLGGAVKYGVQKALPYATAGGLTIGGGTALYNSLKGDPAKDTDGDGISEINKKKRQIGMPENLTLGGGQNIPDIDQDPSLSTKSAEELRAKKVQEYRDIMDIKGMNKTAAYNSLIAASQLINQEGDFKGSIKDGSLINKLIGATSKAFDKPSQTKDAINTLILKGEIDKDIKASDPSNAQLNALRVMQGKKLQRELNPSFDTLKAGFAKDNKGQSGIDLAAGAYSQNNGETFRGPLISKADFKDILSNLKKDPATQDADEVSIIKTWTQGQLDSSRKNIPDGNYTVGDKIVTIQDKIVVDVN